MTRTVIIVEDCDNVAPLEVALASLADTRVEVFSNGRDVLRALAANSIDIAAVITDLNLPLLDGFELTAAIRRDPRYQNLPILVVSGDGRPDVPRTILALGANAFFAKPYSPVEIRHALEVLLNAK